MAAARTATPPSQASGSETLTPGGAANEREVIKKEPRMNANEHEWIRKGTANEHEVIRKGTANERE